MKVKTSSISPAGSLFTVVFGTVAGLGILGWGVSFSALRPPEDEHMSVSLAFQNL
jgi:hypothetical protein